MQKILTLLVCILAFGSIRTAYGQSQGLVADSTELRVLRQFYNATGGANWTTKTGWASLTSATTLPMNGTCYGVSVTAGDVSLLVLNNNNLVGPLPAVLSSLKGLQVLSLAGNQLNGTIPEALGQLTFLQVFNLSNNQFVGALSNALAQLTKLIKIDCSNNLLSGPLPLPPPSFTALQELSLANNRFSGQFFSGYGLLPQLRRLDLTGNLLTGAIPTSLGQLPYLQVLKLGSNKLSGALPAQLLQLTFLTDLDLHNNLLTGPLWNSWGQLAQLRYLDLSQNYLNGGLPPTWGGGTTLQQLRLASNQFTGDIPATTVTAPLLVLDLSANQLDGPLPASVLHVSTLISLNVSGNRLAGTLPNTRWATNLGELRAAGNRFTGALPLGLGRLATLRILDVSRNQLSGTLPDSLADATALTDMNLANNRLTGSIPTSWAALPALARLDVGANQLSGTIPAFNGATLAGLLRFADNHFTGLSSFLYLNPVTSLDVRNNYLDAAALEANLSGPPVNSHAQYPFESYQYAPQLTPSADTTTFLHGTTLHLHRQMLGQHISVSQWERQLAGVWYPLSGQTADDLSLSGAAEADEGYYRVMVTDAWLPGLTLSTAWVYANQIPYTPQPENRPVDRPTPPLFTQGMPTSRGVVQDSVNYVRSYAPQVALTDAVQVTQGTAAAVRVSTTYLDGLGRKVQTVQHEQSPFNRDVVQPHAYDALGREPKQYLPYAVSPGS